MTFNLRSAVQVGALLSILAFGGFAPNSAHAVNPRPTGSDYRLADQNIFLEGEVTTVEVTMDSTEFDFMQANPFLDDQYNCTVRWKNSVIDETITNVGIRPRGGAFTRGATRKSYRLDFNEYVPGRAFYSLEVADLNGEHNDPTFLRRRLAYEHLRRMGLPMPRTHYIALYINGVFRSIQVHCEHIDEEFADSWFGSKDGNLYKCLNAGSPADLSYRPAGDYQTVGGGETYHEENNEPTSDYTDFINFVAFFNNSPSGTVFSGLEDELNIDNFLRYLAANVATGSWDGYWYGSNNFFLYRNTLTNRFEWIPYDYDNSLGMDYFGTNWSNRSFVNWDSGGFGTNPAPLVVAVFAHQKWREQFRRYLLEAQSILVDPNFQALIASNHALIAPYYNGTIESGGAVGAQPTSGTHVPYFENYNTPSNYAGGNFHVHGLKPFMDTRAATLVSQVSSHGEPTPALPLVTINEIQAGNLTGAVDNFGEFEDFVELHNAEASAVDVSGWLITDDLANPKKFEIPAGTVIPAGGFLRLWADANVLQTAPGHIHTNFSLDLGGESVGLYMDVTNGRNLVDYITYPPQLVDRSWGRLPDGGNTFQEFCAVTPGAANDGDLSGCGSVGPRVPPLLYINEFMASNNSGSGIVDNFGESEDWVELYNDELVSLDLSGMCLTDNLANPTKWRFPAGTSIAAKGFLVVWADNTEAQSAPGIPHASWALSAGGEEIGIFDNDANANQPIHGFSYGAQTANVSSGLLPDGTGSPAPLAVPTPGSSNSGSSVREWMLHD